MKVLKVSRDRRLSRVVLAPDNGGPNLDTAHPGISRSADRVNVAACKAVQCDVENDLLGHGMHLAGDQWTVEA